MNVHLRSVRPGTQVVVATIVAGVLASLAGCSTAIPSGPPGSSAASSPRTGTPTATALGLPVSTAALPGGRYRLVGFDPAMTIELDGSWQAVAKQDGYASLTQLSRPPGSNPYVAGTFIQITRVEAVATLADGTLKPSSAGRAADSLKAALGAMFVESSDSRMGGLAGRQATVERPGSGPPMSKDVVFVLGMPPGSLVMFPGDRLWIAFFDQTDGVVAIVVNSSIEGWDAELAAAEPVLEQVRFEAQ